MFGFDVESLFGDDGLIPSSIVLSHSEQLDRLRKSCPAAADIAVIAGDPCFDRMLASRPLRAAYRESFGVPAGRKLVVVSSTWGRDSLFGQRPDLVTRLARELPLDEYRIVLALHPNVWSAHSPWQVRMWQADARRAGVTVLPPEEGWRAALVAADLVIGDHGSVTFYGAALGHPVLLATAPAGALAPDSPVGRLVATAPRLGPDLRLDVAPDPSLAEITGLTTSVPGRSAELLRREIYRMLRLPEPDGPAATMVVPMPEPIAEPVGAQAVAVTLREISAEESQATVARYPVELTGGRTDAHVVVPVRAAVSRWLETADVLVHDGPVATLDRLLAGSPGALLATAPDGPDAWVVVDREGNRLRCHGIGVDGQTGASVVFAWLASGRALRELPPRIELDLGGRRYSVGVKLG